MAVPKTKVSKARRDKRRASTWKAEAPAYTICKCGAPVLTHRMCRKCGEYKGVKIIEVENKDK